MLIRYYLRYDGVNTGDCCCYELYFLNFDATFYFQMTKYPLNLYCRNEEKSFKGGRLRKGFGNNPRVCGY